MANYVIILASGDGKRMGYKTPKCFININKTPIYLFSLKTFSKIKQFKQIILVVPKGYKNKVKMIDKRMIIATGGATRNQSFENGIKTLKNLKKNDLILIHDAARINVKKNDILKLLKTKQNYGTLCYKGPKNQSDLRLNNLNVQTPQFCRYFIYKQAQNKNKNGRDLFTYLNLKPKNNNFIYSSNKSKNFKITFKKDLKKAKSL